MAKSFYTTGTGNEQTLTPIINEKVPIYDTIADAESDLSNLEVGQIVKTKDAGLVANLNPIDEVKQGVFLPPTSNAVAKSLSYSTTEQKTGGKWIDGKDIYRRVFYSATNWATGTVVGTINNIETVICLRNLNANGTGLVHEDYGSDTSNNASTVVVSISTGEVTAYRTGVFVNSLPSTIIVEYTKTTD